MSAVLAWISDHTLAALLAVSAAFTYGWLRRCRDRLAMSHVATLTVTTLHIAVGLLTVKAFAVLEALGDPSNAGSMSLFGAVFFMPLFYGAGARLGKRGTAEVFDVFTPCLIFTLLCARVNCIFAGCCRGAVIPNTTLRFPTRELEIAFYLVLLFALGRKVRSGASRGRIYLIYMISYGIFRFITETFRASNSPLGILHIAHLWALLAVGLGVSIYGEVTKKQSKTGGRHHG